jgi:hypothetical protein
MPFNTSRREINGDREISKEALPREIRRDRWELRWSAVIRGIMLNKLSR